MSISLDGVGDAHLSPIQSTIVLDSNVVLDLDAVARRAITKPESIVLVQNFVLTTLYDDCVPGFALAELCIDRRTGAVDRVRLRELLATMAAWYDGGSTRAADLDAVVSNRARRLAQGFTVLDEDILVPLPPLLQPYYCALMKLALLSDEARGGSIMSFPLQIAHDRLLGPAAAAAYTDRLLKHGRDPLKDLWGAAWDLVHLSDVELAVGDENFLEAQGRAVSLATADIGLHSLRRRLRVRTVVMTEQGSHRMVQGEADIDRRLEPQQQRLDKIQQLLADRALGRMATTGKSARNVVPPDMAANLEQQLLGKT